MYQLLPDTPMGAATCIKRIADNAFIPFDPANSAYAEYLAWLDEGNTPLPADPPPPPDPKMVGIEFEGVMCSATRDDQNGLVAVIIAHQLQKTSFQPTEFKFVNGNRLLMTYENLPKFLAVWMPFRQSFFKPE
jgi:hypothetical protein